MGELLRVGSLLLRPALVLTLDGELGSGGTALRDALGDQAPELLGLDLRGLVGPDTEAADTLRSFTADCAGHGIECRLLGPGHMIAGLPVFGRLEDALAGPGADDERLIGRFEWLT